MRAIVQRVSNASVRIDGNITSEISEGILVFLGVKESDNDEVMAWFVNKLINLRIFPDKDDKMNLSVKDILGRIMIISNFTLYGDAAKGFRPSYSEAARPEIAEPIYDKFVSYMRENAGLEISTGVFGAMMDIELTNSGPVTIFIEKESSK